MIHHHESARSPMRAERNATPLFATMALGILMLVLALFLLRHGPASHLNVRLLLGLHHHVSPGMMKGAMWLSRVLQPSIVGILSLATGGFLWLKGHKAEGAPLALGAILAVAITEVLKHVIHELRPHLFIGPIVEHSYGFPSGHSFVSAGLIVFAAALLGRRLGSGSRIAFIVLALLLGLLIGLSRLVLGVHWPTDVLAGFSLALILFPLCYLALGRQAS